MRLALPALAVAIIATVLLVVPVGIPTTSAAPSDHLEWPSNFPPSAVRLVVDDGEGNGCVAGALLWTAAHVPEKATRVQWSAGMDHGMFAPSFNIDPKSDLAWTPITVLGDSRPMSAPVAKRLPKAGDLLWLVGRYSDGQLIRLPQWALLVDSDKDLLADGMGWPGMSGSCLMNDDGEVVGIHLGVALPVSNMDPSATFFRSASRYAIIVGRL